MRRNPREKQNFADGREMLYSLYCKQDKLYKGDEFYVNFLTGTAH